MTRLEGKTLFLVLTRGKDRFSLVDQRDVEETHKILARVFCNLAESKPYLVEINPCFGDAVVAFVLKKFQRGQQLHHDMVIIRAAEEFGAEALNPGFVLALYQPSDEWRLPPKG